MVIIYKFVELQSSMLRAKFQDPLTSVSEEDVLSFFYHIWAWRQSCKYDPDHFPPPHVGYTYKLALNGQTVLEKKICLVYICRDRQPSGF